MPAFDCVSSRASLFGRKFVPNCSACINQPPTNSTHFTHWPDNNRHSRRKAIKHRVTQSGRRRRLECEKGIQIRIKIITPRYLNPICTRMNGVVAVRGVALPSIPFCRPIHRRARGCPWRSVNAQLMSLFGW